MSKTKKKITAFDIIIGIIIIAIIGYLSYSVLYVPNITEPASNITMKCRVEVKSVSDVLANKIEKGHGITVLENSYATVTDVQKSPSEVLAFDTITGEYHYALYPEKYDVIVEIETTVTDNVDYFSLGESKLRSGTTMEIEGPGYLLKGIVLSMEPVVSESEVQ